MSINDRRNVFSEIQDEDPIDRTLKELDKSIYGDDLVQKILICGITSSKVCKGKLPLEENYTPVNVFIRGDISSGKSHVANRTIELLDPDANTLVHMSQKALYHSYNYSEMVFTNGERIRLKHGRDNSGKYLYYENGPGEQIRITEEMKADNEIQDVVELAGKVLVFSDKQSDDLLLELKPILSGDRKEMASTITDIGSRDLRTKTTMIRGQPCVIFCQALSSYKDMRELVSRCVNVGVDESKEKIKLVMQLTTERLTGTKIISKSDKADKAILQREIELIFRELEENPDTNVISPIATELIKRIYGKTSLVPTDMRDFKNYVKLLELHTLYNHENRPSIMLVNKAKDDINGKVSITSMNHYYFTIDRDYRFLMELIKEFSNTMRSGLPPKAHELLTKVFLNDEYTNKDNKMALNMEEIRKYYNEQTGMNKDKRSIQMTELKWLEKSGFVKKYKNEDKRSNLYEVEIDKSSLIDSEDHKDKFNVTMDSVDRCLSSFEANTHSLQSPDPNCESCQAVPCDIAFSIGSGHLEWSLLKKKSENQIDLETFKDTLLSGLDSLTTYDYHNPFENKESQA